MYRKWAGRLYTHPDLDQSRVHRERERSRAIRFSIDSFWLLYNKLGFRLARIYNNQTEKKWRRWTVIVDVWVVVVGYVWILLPTCLICCSTWPRRWEIFLGSAAGPYKSGWFLVKNNIMKVFLIEYRLKITISSHRRKIWKEKNEDHMDMGHRFS